MNINQTYQVLLQTIKKYGDILTTRNHEVWSEISLPNITFTSFPLITIRKPAWKKAIREMEWFLSGEPECPEELLDWWKGQLADNENKLYAGYSEQFRYSSMVDSNDIVVSFDQVKFILDGLKNNSNSRRLLISMWNPGEMANITNINNNPNTPTCCHSIVVQFFVRNNKLHMKTYQRSADMLLGVPHNWIQSWAMLLYFAYHSNLEVGSMIWMWGDAHIYKEESHSLTADEIIEADSYQNEVKLVYNPQSIEIDENGIPIFKASDFCIEGDITPPIVTRRPKLL